MQQLNTEQDTNKVTSREFVEAIADIEARSNETLADEFVSIEDALSSIGMDIPAEDVMAVIRARRAEASKRLSERQIRRQTSVGRAFAALLCVSMFANLVLIAVVNRHQAYQMPGSITQPVVTEATRAVPQATVPAVVGDAATPPASQVEMEDGLVHIVPGKTGVVKFARFFAHPPNVDITDLGKSKTRVVEITKDGFTWESTDSDASHTLGDYRWTAAGTR
jgi:hypothetical protein